MAVKLDKTAFVRDAAAQKIDIAPGRQLYVFATNGSLTRYLTPGWTVGSETQVQGYAEEALTTPVSQPFSANASGQYDVWFAGGAAYDLYAPNDSAAKMSRWQPPLVAGGGIPSTIVDAKGDLLVGSTADTVIRKAVGTNGYVLTADSAETGGVRWAAAGGSGVIAAWSTGAAYVVGQPVTNGGNTYTANDVHTAGATFAGDLAAHWTLLPMAVKLNVADAAALSNNVPLADATLGAAGAGTSASRSDHVHPAASLSLPQPLVLQPAATSGHALIVKGLASQTGNLQEWRSSADADLLAVNPDGEIGFPQYTGFPRLTAQAYSSFGLLRTTGAFAVDQNFFLVGGVFASGGTSPQAEYGNTSISLKSSELTIQAYSSGASAQFQGLQGFRMPTIVLGTGAGVTPVAHVEIGITATGGKGQVIRAFSSGQTASLAEWQSDAEVIWSRINKAGYFMTRKVAAPADGDLANSEVAIWLDDTIGATQVRFKAKDSAGTVRTAAVALS